MRAETLFLSGGGSLGEGSTETVVRLRFHAKVTGWEIISLGVGMPPVLAFTARSSTRLLARQGVPSSAFDRVRVFKGATFGHTKMIHSGDRGYPAPTLNVGGNKQLDRSTRTARTWEPLRGTLPPRVAPSSRPTGFPGCSRTPEPRRELPWLTQLEPWAVLGPLLLPKALQATQRTGAGRV